MRLTKQEIEEIKKGYEEGKKQSELAIEFGVSQPTINYWIGDELKRQNKIKKIYENYSKKSPEEKREIRLKKRDYMREYINKRYKNDKEFREKWLERSRNYQTKRREKNNEKGNIN